LKDAAVTLPDLKIWLSEYEATRYLRNVPAEGLTSRYQNLIQNLWSTDQQGKVQSSRDAIQRQHILRYLFDVLLEQISRSGVPLDVNFDERAMREEATAAYKPPVLKSPIVGDPQGFAKFDKRDQFELRSSEAPFGSLQQALTMIPPLTGRRSTKSLNTSQLLPTSDSNSDLTGKTITVTKSKFPLPYSSFGT
jgi:hypothetical protein